MPPGRILKAYIPVRKENPERSPVDHRVNNPLICTDVRPEPAGRTPMEIGTPTGAYPETGLVFVATVKPRIAAPAVTTRQVAAAMPAIFHNMPYARFLLGSRSAKADLSCRPSLQTRSRKI